jgi:hypothetical protein
VDVDFSLKQSFEDIGHCMLSWMIALGELEWLHFTRAISPRVLLADDLPCLVS